MPAEGRENPLLKKGNSDAFFREKYLTKNIRTGVLKNTRLDTVLNRSYSELADHYGTAIVPARIHCPQDKSHAEGSVSYASTWILAALRNDTFFSLADAKEAVAEKLEELNGYTFKKREEYLTKISTAAGMKR